MSEKFVDKQKEALPQYLQQMLMRLANDGHTEIAALGARLLNDLLTDGNICIPLATDRHQQLLQQLSENEPGPLIGRPGELKPIILDEQHRAYLYRWHRMEQDLIRWIRARSGKWIHPANPQPLRQRFLQLFPAGAETDWQAVAALTALLRPFSIISGGPGTGKTHTVARFLQLLDVANPPPRVRLTAPTGKAAARLNESIHNSLPDAGPRLLAKLKIGRAVTLHRLLGARPHATRVRYHPENPLPVDVVIVDEVSMVDLELMWHLIRALPDDAQLVLLGDMHQLASVDAGHVLADICDTGRSYPVRADQAERLHKLGDIGIPAAERDDAAPELSGHIVMLRKNYRFGTGNPLAGLAAAVRAGDTTQALHWLEQGRNDVNWINPGEGFSLRSTLTPLLTDWADRWLGHRGLWPDFAAFDKLRLLTPHRESAWGVSSLNELCEDVLARAGYIRPEEEWYDGRPLLIRRNDPSLDLANGDIGVIWPGTGAEEHQVCFPGTDGQLRLLPPALLPEHETVFAMTIHKSQGSEYGHVILVLPPVDSPLLTRELLYTAVTRSRGRLTLIARPDIIETAVTRVTRRISGLRDALWSE